jgi:hypothetical protein
MTIALGSLDGMVPLSSPLRFVLVALAGWVNQQQREVIDYLQEENRALREQLGPRRLQFTDDQRAGWRRKPRHWDGAPCGTSPRLSRRPPCWPGIVG